MKYGCIEAGGTKFVCAILDEKANIIERIVIPTTTPAETFAKMYDFFDDYQVDAFGIASFGPLNLDESNKDFGSISTTPKPGWAFTPFYQAFKDRYQVNVFIDTDVNAAAIAESQFGAAQGLKNVVYYTIGTGIGGGVLVNGQAVHGLVHPEMGHILVRRHPEDDFEGCCPFHKDCLEGLASGPAIQKRWGVEGHLLDPTHKAWDFEAYYIAQACVNAILTVSCEKIICGGGVMAQQHLLPRIHHYVQEILQGYIQSPRLENIGEYIVLPGCKDNAGLLGAFALIQQ